MVSPHLDSIDIIYAATNNIATKRNRQHELSLRNVSSHIFYIG